MATEVKRDIIGSSLFQTESDFGSQAERKVFVRLDPGDAFTSDTLIGKAIEKAIDGQFAHPEDPSLPLKEARGIQIGKDSAEITLRYRRSSSPSGPLDVPRGQSVVSTWRTTIVPERFHSTQGYFIIDGVPTLPANATNAQNAPEPQTRFLSEMDVSIPTVLNTSQYESLLGVVRGMVGTVNSNPLFRFGGVSMFPGELLFTGIDTDWVNERSLGTAGFVNNLSFATAYKFKYRTYGFNDSLPIFDTSIGRWTETLTPRYPSAEFVNFPI